MVVVVVDVVVLVVDVLVEVGIPIAVAIFLHNIPEGISVSVPIFYATGNRRKAFTYSFLSGLAEPSSSNRQSRRRVG